MATGLLRSIITDISTGFPVQSIIDCTLTTGLSVRIIGDPMTGCKAPGSIYRISFATDLFLFIVADISADSPVQSVIDLSLTT